MSTGLARGRRAAALVFFWGVAALASAAVETRTGTVQVLTSDDFAAGTSERILSLVSNRGETTILRLPSGGAAGLEAGARVAVHGTPRGKDELEVESVEVLAAPPSETPSISGNTTVIAILLKFTDTTTEPFTVAQVQDKMFGAQGTSAYYAEASYGAHTLSGIVTSWLTATIPTPTTCDYISVANQAVARAQDAGYNPGSYQKQVYIFPHIPCGWSGLGGGSTAWINQSLSVLVIGHELGHCFGLGHSSSIDCGATVLGPSCSVAEYGDHFSIMGNASARHFSAHYKSQLGYFPPGTVATHQSGSTVYTIQPTESPGASLYAVRVPVPDSSYTYWLEYRQPIGFDSSMSGNPIAGALMHIGPGNPAYSCWSCLLDMTPATAGFGDAALPVGASYTDESASLHVTPLSADASGLVVQVELGPSPPFSVDRHATPGHYPNGVLEAGELATLEPSYLNGGASDAPMTGIGTAFTGPGGATYTISDASADYGTVAPGARASCFDATADCYEILVTAAARPAAHWDATFQETLSDASVRTWPLHVGGSFSDAPPSRGDYRYVETVFHNGITSGCGGGQFCPDASVTRAQMAVFLLRGEHGAAYVPPPATGQVFTDVPANAFAASWIERLAAEAITAGCGTGTTYCPDASVTRAQMAVFLLKTEHGAAWVPPAANGQFSDVPPSNAFAAWIEALADEGITAGCGGGKYCPSQATKRGQMSVFLTKTFALLLYGP